MPRINVYADEASVIGTTRVASWKDDKKSSFLLEFDDSIPTDITNVVPELQKRGLTATFYVNPGTHHYGKAKDKWENELPKLAGVVYGNHTMTHEGLKDFASADADLAEVNAIIFKAFPGKEPRLLSFARPGVPKEKWTISDEDYQKVLKKNNLIAREGAGLSVAQVNGLTTAEGMLKIVDDGIATGTVRSILFHGVGGDWIVTPTDVFTMLLDGLVERRDQVWITDHLSAHKYETEYKTAKVNILEVSNQKICLELKNEADIQFYDAPLTLITQVPSSWKQCQVVQGTSKAVVACKMGQIQFEAMPDGSPISIQPST